MSAFILVFLSFVLVVKLSCSAIMQIHSKQWWTVTRVSDFWILLLVYGVQMKALFWAYELSWRSLTLTNISFSIVLDTFWEQANLSGESKQMQMWSLMICDNTCVPLIDSLLGKESYPHNAKSMQAWWYLSCFSLEGLGKDLVFYSHILWFHISTSWTERCFLQIRFHWWLMVLFFRTCFLVIVLIRPWQFVT